MTDKLSKERRSWTMSRVKSRNTKPELKLRSLLHRAGYRFTVNAANNRRLPGKPDIVLPRYKTVIFVHGCFWHRHAECRQATSPKSRTAFWQEKFRRNVARDKLNTAELKYRGWNVIVVWECELKNPDEVMRSITDRLNPATAAYIAPPRQPLLAAENQSGYRSK